MMSAVQPLRILMVTPRYAPLVGGVETHTAEVSRRLTEAGHKVVVLTANPGRWWSANEHIAGVRVRRVRSWPASEDLFFAPGVHGYIARHARRWDVIHFQGYHTLVAPMGMLVARRLGIPYLLSFHSGGHSSQLRNKLRGVQHLALRPLLAGASKLVAVSEFEAAFFRRRLRLPLGRFVVIPNGAQRIDRPPPVASAGDGTLILSVGRLERYKGHHRLIAAMPGVLRQCPEARLLIVGTGPYEAYLRKLIADLGLRDRVEVTSITGTDRAGMMALYMRATLVALLSDYEAHPIAVMEALALGRPVLVTHTSGLAELADRGLVRAIPPNSTAPDVVAAVLANLRQPLVPQGLTLPDWDACAGALERLYHAVAGRPGPSAESPLG